MKKSLLILGLFTSISLFSQEQEQKEKTKGRFYGGFESNSQWYVNDPEREITQPKEPIRSNNYLPLNYNYGKWSTGLQVEAYAPLALLNYNPKFNYNPDTGTYDKARVGLGTFYGDFKSEKLQATAGYFYEQFGSGLLLRTWEDRQLGINNANVGGRIIYKPTDNLMFTGLYGSQRTGFDVSKGRIYGFNSDFNLSGLFDIQNSDLSFGLTYVGRYEKANIIDPETEQQVEPNFNELTNCYAGRISYNKNSFYISSEYNYKSPDAVLDPFYKVMNDLVKPGNALLMNLGYAKKGIGVDATFRRMENMQFLSEREPEVYDIERNSQYYNDRIMNFIPSLTKQHHFNLANIYVYQAQAKVSLVPGASKAGEIGGQVDFFYEFKKNSSLGGKYGTKVALNGATWFNLKGNYDVGALSYDTEFLGFGEKYFSDYNIELSKKFSTSLSGTFVYINQYYNNKLIGSAPVLVKTNIVASELIYKLSNGKTFKFELEHMWADADRGNWASMMIEYLPTSKWSFFVSDMYNYGYDPEGDLIDHETDKFKIHFYNAGTSYKIGSTRIALGYGRQRGGLVCAGGVCRFVPPSTGLSLSLNTSF